MTFVTTEGTMARGRVAQIGQETTNANGYTYVKTEEGWRPKSELIAEEAIGRKLLAHERIRFRDGDPQNLHKSNLEVVIKKTKSPQSQLAQVEAQLVETKAKLERLYLRKKELEQIVESSRC
jgi:multidrug resistance efflux pump